MCYSRADVVVYLSTSTLQHLHINNLDFYIKDTKSYLI